MKRLIAEISEELHLKIRQFSLDKGMSIKEIVINAVKEYISK